MKLKPFKKDGAGYGNIDMANQHESDKETPIRHGRQGKDEKGETYIGLPARNGRKMTLNKIQHTKVGDDIHFYVNGVENRGIVVKMGGTYVSVFKEDGNVHDIPINETFFVKDILVNKTWDNMSDEERVGILQQVRAYSPRFVQKNWDDLPRELKTVLSEKSDGFKKLKPVYEGDTEQAEKATGMEQNHDKDNLEVEDANHAQTGYAQTQQNTIGKNRDGEEMVNPEIECPECQGSGFFQPASENPLGAELCPDCDGTGRTGGRYTKKKSAKEDWARAEDGQTANKGAPTGTGADNESNVPSKRKEQTSNEDIRSERMGREKMPQSHEGQRADQIIGDFGRDEGHKNSLWMPSSNISGDAVNPKKKSLDDTLKTILELKSDVEHGVYGSVGGNRAGVSTDTPLDVSADTGYEERPHISLEEVGQLPRADAKEHHANEVKETGKKQKIEPHEVKQDKKKGEDGQTGAINTSEGGAFNPVYNAYDTPTTPEETKTGRKISGRDQIKKGIPLSNNNTWGIKYVTKEEKEEQSTKEDSSN